jgi:hypothetical protein
VPLGIALGLLWDLFARQISVVPQPVVPGWPVAFIAIGALALANIVAVVPGRMAGRTPAALLLRAERAQWTATAAARRARRPWVIKRVASMPR